MIYEKKKAWLNVVGIIAIAGCYILGIYMLSDVNGMQPDRYEWRSFVTFLMLFSATFYIVNYLWWDDSPERKSPHQQQIESAQLVSSEYAYFTSISCMFSCIAWFYSPELIAIEVISIVHLLMGTLVLTLLVKY